MPATPAPSPGGIGRTLREARERRGISLRQIANTTRISVSVLESLERDDISRLPGGIFSRAFVRSYAIEVGLDPEDTIRQFIAQFPVDAVTAGHPAVRPVEDGVAIESRQRAAVVFGRLIAVSLPLAAIILYLGTRNRAIVSDGDTGAGVEVDVLAAEPVSSTQPGAPPPTSPAPDDRMPVVAADRLLVGLLATAPCWVSVIADGQSVFAREMQAGERDVVEARRELVLTAGDAAALRLTLNGREARPLGAPGGAATVRMTPDNYTAYLATP
jgi:transcriptional regulator with XRE-family HTH domain